MSFGWSVGDLWTAAKALYDLAKRYHDAPRQFDSLFSELYGLSRVLQDVDRLTATAIDESNENASTELSQIAANCEKVHVDAQRLLQKYILVGSHGARSFSSTAKRTWKRLTMEPEDIKELRSRITSNIVVLETYITISAAVKTSAIDEKTSKISSTVNKLDSNVNEIVDFVELERRQKLLRWISDLDHEAVLADVFSRWQLGTGQWFLNDPRFQGWCSNAGATLLCVGAPGTGKTILSAIIVEHIETVYGCKKENGVVYFYCNFNRSDDQQTLFSSMLRQLVARQCASHALYSELRQCELSDKKMSVAQIKTKLLEVCSGLTKLFLVIDALDEGHFVQYKDFRDFLGQLQDVTDLHLLATSRPIPEITRHFDREMHINLQASNEDITLYIQARSCNMLLVTRRPDLLDLMTMEIIKAASGRFLLAKLHMDSLLDKPTAKALKTALKILPTGSSAYDQAYDSAMTRIRSQPAGRSHLAIEALTWIVHAKTELAREDLLCAMAIEPGTSEQDPDNLSELDDVLSSCAGFVIWDVKMDKVRLEHYTAQEYFSRYKARWFVDSEASLALSCVTYLTYDTWPKAGKRFKTEQVPFYLYAARHWGEHCKIGQVEFNTISTFLEDSPKINTILRTSQSYLTSMLRGRTTSSLNLCAYFNLENYIVALVNQGIDINYEDELGRTPLHIAVACGNVKLVQNLLTFSKLDPNKATRGGSTALHYACWQGFLELIIILLADQRLKPPENEGLGQYIAAAVSKGARVSDFFQNPFDRVPATVARCGSCNTTDILSVLLKDGRFDVNGTYGESALWFAVETSDVTLLRLLQPRDELDVTSGRNATTILHEAARRACSMDKHADSIIVLQFLLNDARVNLNGRDLYGSTALASVMLLPGYFYEKEECIATIKMLLKHDSIDIATAGSSHQSALYIAASANSIVYAELLIQHLVQQGPSSNDALSCIISVADYRSPLFPAIGNKNADMVKLLLDNGANPNAVNKISVSVLMAAVRTGELDVVSQLIAGKANTDFVTNMDEEQSPEFETESFISSYGVTALSIAILEAPLEIVKLLVEEGHANVRLRDRLGLIPADIAWLHGRFEIVSFLEAAAKTQPLGRSISLRSRRGSWPYELPSRVTTGRRIHWTECPSFLHNPTDAAEDLPDKERNRLEALFNAEQEYQRTRGLDIWL